MAYSPKVMEEIAGEDWMYMNWDEEIMALEARETSASAARMALKAAKRAKKVARRAKKKCRKARKVLKEKKELVANSELNANSEPWYPKN